MKKTYKCSGLYTATFEDGTLMTGTLNQLYRQIEPNLAHDAVVTFTAANGCTVRQDAVRNWYVYTDSAHAPKKYSYLASALKCAAVGGCKL